MFYEIAKLRLYYPASNFIKIGRKLWKTVFGLETDWTTQISKSTDIFCIKLTIIKSSVI